MAATLSDSEEHSIESDELSTEIDSNGTLMCLTVGPYKKQTAISNLITELGSAIRKTDLRTEIETKKYYQIISDTFDTLEEARVQMWTMRVAGIVDMMPMNNPGKYRIFLGFIYGKNLQRLLV